MVDTWITIISIDNDKLAFDMEVYFYDNYAVVMGKVINSIVEQMCNLPLGGAISYTNLIIKVVEVDDMYINILTVSNPA